MSEQEEKQLPVEVVSKYELTTAPVGAGVQIRSMDECMKVAKLMCASGYVPDSQSEAKVAYRMLAGIEMGLSPIAALNGLYIGPGGAIGQKAGLIKDQMARKGYSFKTLVFTDEKVEVEFFKGKEALGKIDWTWDRAVKAGMTTGRNADTWGKWKRNMLFKQCIQDGARVFAPGLFNGFETYGEEEVEVMDVDSAPTDGQTESTPGAPEPQQRKRGSGGGRPVKMQAEPPAADPPLVESELVEESKPEPAPPPPPPVEKAPEKPAPLKPAPRVTLQPTDFE